MDSLNKNDKAYMPTLLNRILRWSRAAASILGCGTALSIAFQPFAHAADPVDLFDDGTNRVALKIFSSGTFASARFDDAAIEDDAKWTEGLDADPGQFADYGARLSGSHGQLLWNLYLTPSASRRSTGTLDRMVVEDGAGLFGPAPVPGSGESWGVSAGWSLGDPADSTVLFAGFGYSPRHWFIGEPPSSGRSETGSDSYGFVQYGVGLTAPLGTRLNVGLSFAQRYAGAELAVSTMPDYAAGTSTLGLGLSYGRNRQSLWSTNFTATKGDNDRAPDIGVSVQFPCCF